VQQRGQGRARDGELGHRRRGGGGAVAEGHLCGYCADRRGSVVLCHCVACSSAPHLLQTVVVWWW
jgi:hypothetical protein